MTTLEDTLYAYFYSQNTVNQPQRHAEAVTRIVTDHYADRGQDVADVLEAHMSLGMSGRYICEYGETPDTLAAALAPLLDKARADGAQEVTDQVLALRDSLADTFDEHRPCCVKRGSQTLLADVAMDAIRAALNGGGEHV